MRNGRYVVPVRAEARSRVKGIVHDASGSGQTLFVEPLVVVELGNAWREAQAAVDEEEGRILDELSRAGRRQRDDAARDARGARPVRLLGGEGAARGGAWTASARRRPRTSEVVLLSARHPGLTGRVVPIDLRLGDGYTALVITGPNTGGKTVALRTLGPARPDAPGRAPRPGRGGLAAAGVPRRVRRHRRRAVDRPVAVDVLGPPALDHPDRRARRARARSSCSTSWAPAPIPTEGSALAQALLDHFIRSGALVAATTHYAEIKVYAHETPAARNASVEFDLETLSPTYRLSIGLPGGTQAFAIAERLGLPDAIVADARGRLTENQAAFEATLASIRKQERRDRRGGGPGPGRGGSARPMRCGRPTRSGARPAASATRRYAPPATRRSGSSRALRDDVAGVRRRLERETVTAPAIDAALARAEQTLGPPAGARRRRSRPGRAAAPRTWRLGDRARSRNGGWEGRIAALEKGGTRATLEAGGMRVSVAVDDLEEAVGGGAGSGGPADDRGVAGDGGRGRGPGSGPAGAGIGNLQLERRHAASPRRWTSAARGSTRPSRRWTATWTTPRSPASSRCVIIHGLGTGALRDAVRVQAGAHPLVKSFRAGERGEGGDGATIVRL